MACIPKLTWLNIRNGHQTNVILRYTISGVLHGPLTMSDILKRVYNNTESSTYQMPQIFDGRQVRRYDTI